MILRHLSGIIKNRAGFPCLSTFLTMPDSCSNGSSSKSQKCKQHCWFLQISWFWQTSGLPHSICWKPQPIHYLLVWLLEWCPAYRAVIRRWLMPSNESFSHCSNRFPSYVQGDTIFQAVCWHSYYGCGWPDGFPNLSSKPTCGCFNRPSESAAGINDQKYNVLKSALIYLGVR